MESRTDPTLPRPRSYQDMQHLEKTQLDALASEALAAVEHVGPRTYRLKMDKTATEFQFLTLGCHGDGGSENQRAVAKLMDDIVDQHKKSPTFVLFLGDNVYDWGVDSPMSPDFEKVHHSVYGQTAHISKLPCFMILGNHDENFQSMMNRSRGWNNGAYGYEVGKHEVAHTYANDANAYTQLFSREKLKPKELGLWVMPYFFYSIIIGNTQIFCLNSNRLLGDCYDHLQGKTSEHPNQATWLVEAYQKARAAHRQVFIAQHHPLSTDGKRSNPDLFDSRHYYSNHEIRSFNKCFGTETYSFNQLLAAALMKLDIYPDAVLAAHDHFIRYAHTHKTLKDKPLPEFTFGGGGGKLTHRVRLDEFPNVACHFKQFGCGLFTVPMNAHGFELEIFTTQGLHLKYNHESSLPICNASADFATEQLKHKIRVACTDYLKMLKKAQPPIIDNYHEPMIKTALYSPMTFFNTLVKPKPSHEEDMIIVHDIVGLIDQLHSLNYNDLKTKISLLITKLHDKHTPDSLYDQLNKILSPPEQLSIFSLVS